MSPNPDLPVRGGVRTVCVVGGGTAGYFVALALKKRFAGLDVTLIESRSIPVIGVGEATTNLMPSFLHAQLGLDIVELYRAVRPTWKLGIRFDWGLPGDYSFAFPFGPANPYEAYAFEGDLSGQSLTSMLMAAERSPIIEDASGVVSLLPQLKFAYHLDNEPFVRFLAAQAAAAGIRHVDAVVTGVDSDPGQTNVGALRLDDGSKLQFDLYVDATGFRSRLLEGALGSPFESYEGTLFCDAAVVATVPHDGHVAPYTRAETMDSGWCWGIPLETESHRGYVFSSRFVSADEAAAEMRRKNPRMGEPRLVRFRSGRHRDFWKGNLVAVGNAYAFVEPLESTALHMVIVEIAYLLDGLEAPGEGPPDSALASARVSQHWDYLRWFLGLHYRFNRRLDTPFWRTCRADVDIGGLAPLVEDHRARGPWHRPLPGPHYIENDPTFGIEGATTILLGQQVDAPIPSPAAPRAMWEARRAAQRELVDRAMPQARALEWLRAHPEALVEFATDPSSWCRTDSERLGTRSRAGSLATFPDRARATSSVERPYADLVRGFKG